MVWKYYPVLNSELNVVQCLLHVIPLFGKFSTKNNCKDVHNNRKQG